MTKLLFKMDLSYSKRSNTILYLIIHCRKKLWWRNILEVITNMASDLREMDSIKTCPSSSRSKSGSKPDSEIAKVNNHFSAYLYKKYKPLK
jgi:tryptophan 2,3-dioxygenase